MTDTTSIVPSTGRLRLSTEQKPKPPRVPANVANAITLMIEEGLPWNMAAERVGLSARTMRLSLERPHVIKWMKAKREVFRDYVCLANIHRLQKIADHKPNMPAVNAILALERRDDERAAQQRQAVPGFVIVCKGDVQVHHGANDTSAPDIRTEIDEQDQ